MIKSKILAELNQDNLFRKGFVLKILCSKRLLIDHMETLEEAVEYSKVFEFPQSEYFTFLKTSGLIGILNVTGLHCKNYLKHIFAVLSVAVSMPYLYKFINIKIRQSYEFKLENFIMSLNNYESAIKKNKNFLQEANLLKSSANVLQRYDKDNKFVCNLVRSIKNVIDGLYKLLKFLEIIKIPERLEMIYEPIEDLKDCELMSRSLEDEIELKTIKDFFNIFAYVQSQTLLRFGLITLSDTYDAKNVLLSKIEGLTVIIDDETRSISKLIDIIESASKLKQKSHELNMTTGMPVALREIRSESSRISTKILALAVHSQNLEDLIENFCSDKNNKNDDDITNLITRLQSDLAMTQDELERIMILVKKYLNIELESDKIPQEKMENLQNLLDNVKKITDEDSPQHVDDFFFVDGKENEPEEETKNRENDEIEEVDSKLAKKYFKPVLVQLRERIEVIGEDFKEREKKVLKSKGIEIDEISQEPAKPIYSDEDSGSDDERERQRRFSKNQEKFKENREFLESKQQVNIFGGFIPPPKPSENFDEDVIE